MCYNQAGGRELNINRIVIETEEGISYTVLSPFIKRVEIETRLPSPNTRLGALSFLCETKRKTLLHLTLEVPEAELSIPTKPLQIPDIKQITAGDEPCEP